MPALLPQPYIKRLVTTSSLCASTSSFEKKNKKRKKLALSNLSMVNMVRGCGKLNLQFIREDGVRKATFKRRYQGLKKKIHELSTLCGVDACMITYGPMNGSDGRIMKLDTWPPSQEQVQQIVNRYQQLDETKKNNNVGLTDFIKGENKKIAEEFTKLRQNNNENWINCLSKDQLLQISAALDSKIQTIDERIKLIGGNQGSQEEETKLIEYHNGLHDQTHCDLVPMQKQMEYDQYLSLMNSEDQKPMVIAPNNLYGDSTAMQTTMPLTNPVMPMNDSDFKDLYDLPNMNFAPQMNNYCPMTNPVNGYDFNNNYFMDSSGGMNGYDFNNYYSDQGASTSSLPFNMQSEPYLTSYPPYMVSAS